MCKGAAPPRAARLREKQAHSDPLTHPPPATESARVALVRQRVIGASLVMRLAPLRRASVSDVIETKQRLYRDDKTTWRSVC